jgi:F0F1-type ATP synthase assembly protein I
MQGTIAVFIPIIMFLVIGLVLVTYIYFRSRERQMMIDKGMTPEQIAELFKSKKNPFVTLEIGIITVFSGIGIGIGVFIQKIDFYEGLSPLFIISFIGLGFIAAFFAARKFKIEDKNNEI